MSSSLNIPPHTQKRFRSRSATPQGRTALASPSSGGSPRAPGPRSTACTASASPAGSPRVGPKAAANLAGAGSLAPKFIATSPRLKPKVADFLQQQAVEPYVCSLDEKTQRKAEQELKEDPATRLDSVQTLRDWVSQQAHITCPTDTRFLLAFLRVRYFSQPDARKLIENFWTRRTKFPQWFRNLDPCCPRIRAALDDGSVNGIGMRESLGVPCRFA